MNVRRAALAFASLAPLFACSSDAEFHVKLASDVAHPGTTVSVLGLYKDGRLSPEAWDAMGAALSAPFGGKCEIEYDDALAVKDNALSTAIDDFTRANGVTDDFVERIAPAAKGDLVVVFTVSGTTPQGSTGSSSSSPLGSTAMGPSTSALGSSQSRGMGRMPHGGMPRMQGVGESHYTYDLSATFYSVREHRSVGIVAMGYGGRSADDAMRRFTARVREELPGATCAGWDKETKIDPERIRSIEP